MYSPQNGKILQMAPDSDDSKLLDNKSTKRIQSIVGIMLYYYWSVDPTIIKAINEISRIQSNPTRDNEGKEKKIKTYPNVIICYKSSNMVLHVDSDAAYQTML